MYQAASQEGWVYIMYRFDSHSIPFKCSIYFYFNFYISQSFRLLATVEGLVLLHDHDLLPRLDGEERLHRGHHGVVQRDEGSVPAGLGGEGSHEGVEGSTGTC